MYQRNNRTITLSATATFKIKESPTGQNQENRTETFNFDNVPNYYSEQHLLSYLQTTLQLYMDKHSFSAYIIPFVVAD